MAALIGLFGALTPSVANAAPGDPFSTANPTVFIGQSATAADGTRLLRAEAAADGSFSFVPDGNAAAGRYNAMGWNPANGYIYAVTSNAIGAIPAAALIRIGQNNVITRVGTQVYSVPDAAAGRSTAFFAGAFNSVDGLFYFGDNGPTIAVNAITGAIVKRLPTNALGAPDFVEHGGFFWAQSGNQLLRTSPTTGEVTSFPSPIPGGQSYGAAYQFGNGNLGFSGNTTGTVYQISVTNPASATPTIALVSAVPGPSASFNDGTSTPGLPADVAIVKTGPQSFNPGASLTYQLTVTNNGAGVSSGWIAKDTLPAGLAVSSVSSTANCTVAGSAITCTGGRLAVGDSVDITITVTSSASLTQCVTNTATVLGNERDDVPANNTSSVTSCPNIIGVVKSATPSDPASYSVGQAITYTFVATNSGQTTLTNVTVNETAFSGTGTMSALSPASVASLAPGATATFTATYTLTQADVDAGSVTNSAAATGTPPDGTPPVSPPSTAAVPVLPGSAISLVKSADVTQITTAGQTVTYSFVATNTGNVTLTDVTVDETAFSGAGVMSALSPASVASLAAGESATFSATYTTTQADVDSASLDNAATATGTPPTGAPPVSPPSSVSIPTIQSPAITLEKSADTEEIVAAGQVVTYSFLATNTGNVTLTDVVINETSFSGSGTLSALSPASVASLAPEETATFTATYTVTQADVDAGSISNVATTTGIPPAGTPPVSPPSGVEIPVTQTPAIAVVKSASPSGPSSFVVGQVITYSFLTTNTGNVTLTDVTIDEADFSGSGSMSALSPGSVASLAPGESTTFTATYTLTQTDIDSGSVTNTATATGTPPDGETPVSPPSTVEIPIVPTPAISVVKTASPSGPDTFVVGQVIDYTFVATNSGNVTLTEVTVDETEFSGSGSMSALTPASVASLAPGASATFTASYTLTLADVDSGSVTNTATATGTPPTGTPPVSPPSTVEIPVIPEPAISIVKTASPSGPTFFNVGQTINYTFVATNTGNVTLTDVTVDEAEFSGSGSLSALLPASVATLAPGASATFTATYTLTAADVDSGSVTNTATATGTPPTGEPPVSPPSTVEIPVLPAPGISVVKTADTEGITSAGQLVTYSFLVTNTGNVTLTDVTVDESAFSGSGPVSALSPTSIATLASGASATFTATYTTTQADVDSGLLSNTATATGTPPTGEPPVSPPSTVEIPVGSAPSITVVKSASPAGPETFVVGQVITYTFVVTNTGNVTLANVTVEEGEFTGSETISALTPAVVASLAPGAAATFTANYTLTQADVDAGSVTNTATATGTPPTGEPPVSPPSTVQIPVVPAPALSMVKTADKTVVVSVGEILTYSFAVTNTGNVTIGDIHIDETLFTGTGELGVITCGPSASALAPGQSVVCQATYRTTAADLASGKLINTAVAVGTPGETPTPVTSTPSTVNVSAKAVPSNLAGTGVNGLGIGMLALALFLGGAALITLSIRRRRRAH